MKVAWKSDRGRVRENNEDSVLVDKELGLLLVADGMGGHNGGEIASRMAVTSIAETMRAGLEKATTNEQLAALIHNAVVAADAEIRSRATTEPALQGMGTTLVLALVRDGMVHIAHAGDSRAYLIRNTKIQQLTEDHSLAVQAEKTGTKLRWPGRRPALRNMITRSLGNQVAVEEEYQLVAAKPGDVLVLCTDGLSNLVDQKDIRKIVLRDSTDFEQSCRELVDLANERGGQDNISVIVAQAS
ncbi:MAG TPA: Stp1/IreP family PP2C-type Ser/Thr phosphatase [Candidatus Nitrosotenuis sp.]|nr:Stp1/IreP family PP2C-type Ser/Thr phosphatase [Candidatus Nitrosotenuis sp.]